VPELGSIFRSVTDVKGVIMGVNQMKLKAELEFDGRNITRAYLETLRPGDEDNVSGKFNFL